MGQPRATDWQRAEISVLKTQASVDGQEITMLRAKNDRLNKAMVNGHTDDDWRYLEYSHEILKSEVSRWRNREGPVGQLWLREENSKMLGVIKNLVAALTKCRCANHRIQPVECDCQRCDALERWGHWVDHPDLLGP